MAVKLIHGDSLEVLKKMKDNRISSIVTDPPYGWSMLGKKWDYQIPSVELWQECLRVLKPGGYALVACGTRTQHRMAVNLEDAGFEIIDIVVWAYGQGFPKSLNVAKSIEGKLTTGSSNTKDFGKLNGERLERGGWGISKLNKVQGYRGKDYTDETEQTDRLGELQPTTEEAKKWIGWGTRLKPAWEAWICVQKPEQKLKEYGIIDIIEYTLGVMIWQSLKKLEKMDTCKLLEMGLIPLSIALLWKNILVELWKKENTFTTSMELEMITELKILSSLISKNIIESTPHKKYRANGLNMFVSIVESLLKDSSAIKNDLEATKYIVTEIASLNTKLTGLFAETAELDLEMLNPIVSFALKNVLTNFLPEQDQKNILTPVVFAESLLKLLGNDNQNTAEESVCQKPLENLSPNMTLWTLCQKPIEEPTIAENLLEYGVGAINIDVCRVQGEPVPINKLEDWSGFGQLERPAYKQEMNTKGRFPANLLIDGSEEVVALFPKNPESTSRFFYVAKVSKREKDEGLDELLPKSGGNMMANVGEVMGLGGASLRGEPKQRQPTRNVHPTCKPIDLMKYLVTLVTPPNGKVLDPFMGSGSTGIACVKLGFPFIGIDLEEEYVEIAKKRIEYWTKETENV